MRLGEIMFLPPDEIAFLCRSVGIYAPTGTEALRMLLKRRVSDSADIRNGYIEIDGHSYLLTGSMRTFIHKFNSMQYPEIDDPAHRSAAMYDSDPAIRFYNLLSARRALGDTPESITTRLQRAGCFGETPLDVLDAWFSMYMASNATATDGYVYWMGLRVEHDDAMKEWIARWDEFPQLHFTLHKQIEAIG